MKYFVINTVSIDRRAGKQRIVLAMVKDKNAAV